MQVSKVSGLNSQILFGSPSFNGKIINPKVKVSVILAIYNQEKYLNKAISSLQKQTLKDAEFICVNDGSKDNSLNILKELAAKDNRVKIIDQKNQGAGCARNNGLKNAKGEYVAFLDPDDWFEPEALDLLYQKSKKQNCDVVVFNFNKVGESGNLLGNFNLKEILKNVYDINESETFNWRDIKSKVFGGLFPAAWNKFYKNDFIAKNNLHFTNCSLAEDHVFVFGATLNAENIGYLDKNLYNYLIHDKSMLHSKSDKNLCMFKSFDSVKKLLKNLELDKELATEFDAYIKRIAFFFPRIKSYSKFKEACQRNLTAEQNAYLEERYSANMKILPILNSLIAKKGTQN